MWSSGQTDDDEGNSKAMKKRVKREAEIVEKVSLSLSFFPRDGGQGGGDAKPRNISDEIG